MEGWSQGTLSESEERKPKTGKCFIFSMMYIYYFVFKNSFLKRVVNSSIYFSTACH